MKITLVTVTNTWAYTSIKKLNFDEHSETKRNSFQIKGNVERKTINARYSIFYITSCFVQYGVLLYGLARKNQSAENLRIPKKVNKDSLKASHQDQIFKKIQRSKNRNSI